MHKCTNAQRRTSKDIQSHLELSRNWERENSTAKELKTQSTAETDLKSSPPEFG